MRKIRKSLTLIELIVVTFIIIMGIVPSLGAFVSSVVISRQAKELNVAIADAGDVLERINAVAFSDVPTVFPNGSLVSAATIGGLSLANESITISYPLGVAVDPLQINITVSWRGSDNRPYQETFTTLRTRIL